MIRLMAASLLLLAAASAHGETENFQLFTHCQPVSLYVGVTENFGLTEERVRTVAESRLRAARLYNPIPFSAFSLSVYVDTMERGHFTFQVFLEKKLFDPVTTESWLAVTWKTGQFGNAGNDAGFIIQAVSEQMDKFINEYLRVNERDCE